MSLVISNLTLPGTPRRRSLVSYLVDSEYRTFRVMLLVTGVCLFNIIDLIFTIIGVGCPGFRETNVLASSMTAGQMAIFKIAAVGFFVAICVWGRHFRTTEMGCWLLFAVYGILAAVWFGFYGFLLKVPFL